MKLSIISAVCLLTLLTFACSQGGGESIVPLESGSSFLLTGDIDGGREEEIIVVDGSSVRISSPQGKMIREISLDVPSLFSGIIGDINGDGKSEIILGTDRNKSAGIIVLDGLLNTVMNYTAFPGRTQRTKPIGLYRDTLYFVSYSTRHMLAKGAGAANVKTGETKWTYDSAAVPYDGMISEGSGRLVISNRAFSGEEHQAEIPYRNRRDKHALIVLDLNTGVPAVYREIGPAAREGFVVPQGISGINSRIDDLDDDGEEELYVLVGRLSEFYQGRAELLKMNGDGSAVLKSFSGPEKTEGEMHSHIFRGERALLVFWKQAGIIELFNSDLESVRRYTLPGRFHDLKYFGSGSYIGREDGQILFRDGNILYILDSELKLLWSNAFTGVISSAAVTGAGPGNRTLAVSAGNECRMLRGEWRNRWTMEVFTEPAGADIFIDGEPASYPDVPLFTGYGKRKLTVSAELREQKSLPEELEAEPGRHKRVRLEIPDYKALRPREAYSQLSMYRRNLVLVPPAAAEHPLSDYGDFMETGRWINFYPVSLLAAEDFLGTEKKELLLYRPGTRENIILDADLNLLRRIPAPEGPAKSFLPVGDFDGDGKADLGDTRTRSPDPMYIAYRSADNKELFRKELFYSTDSTLSNIYRDADAIAAAIITGYQIQPRSFLTLSPETGELTLLFHRAATFRGGTEFCRYQGSFFLSAYTPSNGGTYTRDNGAVEHDSEIVIHMLNDQGQLLPGSGVLNHENNSGHVFPLIFDFDGDGRREFYYFEGKNVGYYEGQTILYRIDERSGERTPVYLGPRDEQTQAVRLVKLENKLHLAILWRESGMLEVMDSGFNRILRIPLPDTLKTFGIDFIDADDDGTTEMIGWSDERVSIFRLDGTPVTDFSPDLENSEDKIKRVYVDDIDLDGKMDMIINSQSGIIVYTYD